MQPIEFSSDASPFGLLELDPAGQVLYYKPEQSDGAPTSPAELVGRNLFTEWPALAQAKEFQGRLHRFHRSHAPADSFLYDFPSECGSVQTKVLLARLHERSADGNVETILVHIRKA